MKREEYREAKQFTQRNFNYGGAVGCESVTSIRIPKYGTSSKVLNALRARRKE